MTTTNEVQTLQVVLDKANPETLADALRKVKLGTLLTPLKITKTGMTLAAAHDITDHEHGHNPPILAIIALRVTVKDTAAFGVRMIGDAAATLSTTVARLSDDGKTITFEGTVSGFVLEYIPRSDVDMTDVFAPIS